MLKCGWRAYIYPFTLIPEATVIPYKTLILAHSPTPLYRLDKLSETWGGDIWIKRDDLTGSGMTGNKVRKLEHLIADAECQGADTLITCGGVQSNHCRATALAAARLGYRCILLLRGDRPDVLDGNLLLDRLAGAETVFVGDDEYRLRLSELLQGLSDEVQRAGGKPYIIAEGGSDPIGARGYIEALKEIREQCESAGMKPKRIVFATGSGGTHAGLLAGVQITNWDVEIISAAICYDRPQTAARVATIMAGMNARENLGLDADAANVQVIPDYIGPGYAKAHQPVYEVIAEVARSEGILLDPVYTGKAAWCVRNETMARNFQGTTIFLHTGGVFGIFPFKKGLQEVLGWG